MDDYRSLGSHTKRPTIHHLTQPAQYELYHQCFGHPGERAMSELHKYIDDVPQLKGNAFYKCSSCMHAKCKQRPHKITQETGITKQLENTNSTEQPQSISTHNGRSFYMDFGFMKGTGYCHKDDEGRTITSIDGYRNYLLIIDKASRYIWIFLTKTKSPPIEILKCFFEEHGNKQVQQKTVRTDEGGELWSSAQFKQTIMEAGYLLEPTTAGAPFQNGLAE
jgi:hypothetical protein